jgi:hypothetical protein
LSNAPEMRLRSNYGHTSPRRSRTTTNGQTC